MALMATAALTGLGAVVVLLLGVILTTGVYGSRMAWLVGVGLSMLGLTAMSTWLASMVEPRTSAKRYLRVASLVALAFIAIPFVLAGLLLVAYLLLLIRYEIGRFVG